MEIEYFSSPVFATRELYEYLFVVSPGSEVYKKVMAEKQLFYEEYKEKIAIKTLPHITVANFLASENMEETIIRWIQRICSKQPSFTVTLNNYSGFPRDTIYLRIQNATPFQQLTEELKVVDTYIRSCSCPSVRFISRPHLTIASSLPEEIYFKAITRYARKSFYESFVVNELLLLRRGHQYDKCKPINVFGLQPAAMSC
ncbi:MAG: 2'-5' RNA ligase family protein [Ginsengibacter sp.]